MSETLPFEKALHKLEKIVSELESGDIALEEALKKYEEGVKLSRACQLKLVQAEKRIEVLSKAASGEWISTAFDEESLEEGQSKPANRKPKQSASPEKKDDDELLI